MRHSKSERNPSNSSDEHLSESLLPIRKGLVTAIIPVFNQPQLVRDAVASVLAQSYQSVQIILIDDGSTDITPRVLKRLAKKSSIIKILTQQNAGSGTARQLGLTHAEGEYIQFLDSDDILLPRKFSSQIELLKKSRLCVAAYGKTELSVIGRGSTGVAWKRTGEAIETMFPHFLNERWWGTSAPLYRHCELRKLGPILPLVIEEDWELDCRLAARGGQLAYVDEFVSIQYRHHADHLSRDAALETKKLIHRCLAKRAIHDSARRSRVKIPDEDFKMFSKSVFLLAKECAELGLSEQVRDMLRLSIKVNKGPSKEHLFFVKAGNFMGWRAAAALTKGTATLTKIIRRLRS